MFFFFFFFFFKQKTAYEIMPSLVGSEMCIRDRSLYVQRPTRLYGWIYSMVQADHRIVPDRFPAIHHSHRRPHGIQGPCASWPRPDAVRRRDPPYCRRLWPGYHHKSQYHVCSLYRPGCGQYHKDLSLIHISEPTRLGMISYAVFCLKKKKTE